MSSEVVVYKTKMLKSRAYRELSGNAKTILGDFYIRRKFERERKGSRGKRKYVFVNNGRIVYTYADAVRNGFTRPVFQRNVDLLVTRGFLDVTHRGSGRRGDCSLYGISDRWENWGTDKFVRAEEIDVERQKDTRKGRGFAAYWDKRRGRKGEPEDDRPDGNKHR